MAQTDEFRPEQDSDTGGRGEYIPPNLCRAPAYPYRQLIDNDIRLLNILPGRGILECSLHQMPLTKGLVFRALSYVWGSTSEVEEIILEGRPFKVTRNLHDALQQLRIEQPGPTLELGHPNDYHWIDAICLNQEDVDEKSSQVPRMMEIYQTAYVVLVWLGVNGSAARAGKVGRKAALTPHNPAGFLQRGGSSADEIVGLLFEKAGSVWTEWKIPDDEAEQESTLREVFGESYSAILQASAEILQRPVRNSRVQLLPHSCCFKTAAMLFRAGIVSLTP